MTIILFLVDSSASMGQKTYLGTTYLDAARSTIELFWKLRQKDPVSKGDRYMLMTFDDFPKNVRSGWREGQATLSEQLKNLQPHGVTAFGPALGSAFRFVNLNRAQSGIENYGFGRHPYYVEPVVIVAFTDGGSLSTLREGTTGEIKFMRPEIPGTEMTEEPFRWDQRLYTVVLRYSGHPLKQKIPANAAVPSDRSHIDVMCQATGGRSYCVLSHKMIQQVVEDILKRVQLGGVLARFEKTGTDPPRVVIENENGAQVTIGIPQNEAWKNQLLNICKPVRIGPSSYVGHWPIPEAFWPDSTMAQFPPRKAHPVIQFKCDPCPQQLNNDFPFDKYELEPSALTQMILERRQVNVCWQVFVQNSATTPGIGHPFGYIKPSSNMQTVNLFIMPYNYPVILSILDEFKEARGRASGAIRSKLERYLTSVPFYYYGPLKKALKRINLTHQLLEEPGQVYPYSTVGYLNKIKATAKEEQEQLVVQVGENVQQSTAANLAVNVQVPILRTIQPPPAPTDDRRRSVIPSPPLPKDIFANFKITLSESKMRTATYNDPSSYFKNPFDVNRGSLIGQLTKMKMNFEQRLSDSTIPVLEGGMPGTRIKLQQAESLHSQTISTMGDYNAYMNRLKAIGGTRKLAEDKMARFHAFGNPFKEKKGMAIDEVGSLNETNAPGSSSPNKSVDKSRPRRKSGPLQFETGSAWRKRLRSISMSGSDTSSVFSDFSDVASISSLENDVIVDEAECSTGLVIAEEEQMEVSNGNENGSATAHAPTTNGRPKDVHKPAQNGTASRKRKLDLPNNVKLPEATTAAVNNKLTTEQLRRRKLAICSIARTLSQRPEQICQRVVEAIGDVGVEDQLKIVKQAMHQAEKLKREKLLCCLEKEHQRLRDKREASKSPLSPTSTTGVH